MHRGHDIQSRPPEAFLVPAHLHGIRLFLWHVRYTEEWRWLRIAALRVMFGIAILGVWEFIAGRWIDEQIISSPRLLAGRVLRWRPSGHIGQESVMPN